MCVLDGLLYAGPIRFQTPKSRMMRKEKQKRAPPHGANECRRLKSRGGVEVGAAGGGGGGEGTREETESWKEKPS